MAALQDVVGLDLSHMGYAPVQSPAGAAGAPPSVDQQPGFSPYMRCPLPPIWQASPDSLRQFYTSGVVPQTRLLTPTLNVASGTSGTTSTSSTTSSSSSSSTTTTATIKAAQAALTTPLLQPNTKFTHSIAMSKSFQLLTVTVTGAARVEMYGNTTAQSLDMARGLDVPPPAGTMQNIICDVILDTAPYTWAFQDRVGANNDNPQTANAYLTITNVGTVATALTVTIVYVPLENA